MVGFSRLRGARFRSVTDVGGGVLSATDIADQYRIGVDRTGLPTLILVYEAADRGERLARLPNDRQPRSCSPVPTYRGRARSVS